MKSTFRPPWAILLKRQVSDSFTLIELMAATTVLSVILLMMVGMQDQMSRAWSNSNRRTDTSREARAACRLMAKDFSYLALRGTNSTRVAMRGPEVTNSPISFYYFGTNSSTPTIGQLTMPTNLAPNTSYLFGVIPRLPRTTNESDFGLIGYYVASDTMTNINGFYVTSYNLHRYYKILKAETIPAFRDWIVEKSADSLFPKVNPDNDEIVARNVSNLQIKVFGSTNYANGISSVINYGGNYINGIYQGNKIHFEITFYPDDVAQKFTSLTNWTDTNNIRKYARSYEFRVDCTETID